MTNALSSSSLRVVRAPLVLWRPTARLALLLLLLLFSFRSSGAGDQGRPRMRRASSARTPVCLLVPAPSVFYLLRASSSLTSTACLRLRVRSSDFDATSERRRPTRRALDVRAPGVSSKLTSDQHDTMQCGPTRCETRWDETRQCAVLDPHVIRCPSHLRSPSKPEQRDSDSSIKIRAASDVRFGPRVRRSGRHDSQGSSVDVSWGLWPNRRLRSRARVR